MRSASFLVLIVLAASSIWGQAAEPAAKVKEADAKTLLIPAGTKVPLALKQAISTKSAKEGDPVYAETTFPFVVNDRIIIPAGTYVQGKIARVKRPGRVKGRAELLMHFTSMIYPSGYTVMLPGSVENMPGAQKTSMKGEEGTIRLYSGSERSAESNAALVKAGVPVTAMQMSEETLEDHFMKLTSNGPQQPAGESAVTEKRG